MLRYGYIQETIHILTENEVDGCSLLNLNDQDLHAMMPGKVGAVRKIKVLIDRVTQVC